jgi:hypothetical protein
VVTLHLEALTLSASQALPALKAMTAKSVQLSL